MRVALPYGTTSLDITVPDDAALYRTAWPAPERPAEDLVLEAVRQPIGSAPLAELIRAKAPTSVVVVVSDITRPIPYATFLPALLAEVESAGVPREAITVLIATGMHRPSTPAERERMFGADVCDAVRIIDHRADDPAELAIAPGTSWSGRPIELNRHFLAADFRIVTGLVEPHFMAGFSGGRKAVCPGLASLETVQNFHGVRFLADPAARNACLDGNPLHEEARSIAEQVGVDFCLNVIINREHRLVDALAGGLAPSHAAACDRVRRAACPAVDAPHDAVLTSSGGDPLDATFYQCVKGLVSCLPTVREGGTIIAAGACCESLGSPEYTAILREYAGRWQTFLGDLRAHDTVAKDQWELQMQLRALEHVGEANLHFVTSGVPEADLPCLNAQAIRVPESEAQAAVQRLVDGVVADGRSLAVIPEGPYCAPVV